MHKGSFDQEWSLYGLGKENVTPPAKCVDLALTGGISLTNSSFARTLFCNEPEVVSV